MRNLADRLSAALWRDADAIRARDRVSVRRCYVAALADGTYMLYDSDPIRPELWGGRYLYREGLMAVLARRASDGWLIADLPRDHPPLLDRFTAAPLASPYGG